MRFYPYADRLTKGGDMSFPDPPEEEDDTPDDNDDHHDSSDDIRGDLYEHLSGLLEGYAALYNAGSQLTHALSMEILIAANALALIAANALAEAEKTCMEAGGGYRSGEDKRFGRG